MPQMHLKKMLYASPEGQLWSMTIEHNGDKSELWIGVKLGYFGVLDFLVKKEYGYPFKAYELGHYDRVVDKAERGHIKRFLGHSLREASERYPVICDYFESHHVKAHNRFTVL